MRSMNKPRVTHLNITCLQLRSQQSRLYDGEKKKRNKKYETNNACAISALQRIGLHFRKAKSSRYCLYSIVKTTQEIVFTWTYDLSESLYFPPVDL